MVAASTRFSKLADRRSRHRRNSPRAAVMWPVTVLHDGVTLRGKTGNVSRGGALLYLQEQLGQGDTVRIAIEIPDCRDAIAAEGEVIRSFSLKRGAEEQSSFAHAIRFHHLSDNDLRFFCGNLAPEWKDGEAEYQENEAPGLLSYGLNKYALIALAVIVISSLIYFLQPQEANKAADLRQFEQLDARLQAIERQLESFRSLDAAISQIDEKMDVITDDLSNLKKTLPPPGQGNAIAQKTASSESPPVDISGAKKERAAAQTGVGTTNSNKPSQTAYHIVKKGENLYRIGLSYNLSVEKIKELNNLSPTSEIFPGQKLLVR